MLTVILDCKFSPYSESCFLFSGWFPSFWILCADVSEHSASILSLSTCADGTEWSETSANEFQMSGNHPKEIMQHTDSSWSWTLLNDPCEPSAAVAVFVYTTGRKAPVTKEEAQWRIRSACLTGMWFVCTSASQRVAELASGEAEARCGLTGFLLKLAGRLRYDAV